MTSDDVKPDKSGKRDGGRELSPEQAAAAAMVAEAKKRGLELTGPDGLLKLFTKSVLETALNEEMTGYLGHEKNQADVLDVDKQTPGLSGDYVDPWLKKSRVQSAVSGASLTTRRQLHRRCWRRRRRER